MEIRTAIQIPFPVTLGLNCTAPGNAGGGAGEGCTQHWADMGGCPWLSCWEGCVRVYTECVWMLLCDVGCPCVCPIICVLVCLCVGGLIGLESHRVCHRVTLCVCCFLSSLYQRFWSRESHPCHSSALTQTAAQEEGPNLVSFSHSQERQSLQTGTW